MNRDPQKRGPSAHNSRAKWVLAGFLIVAGYFLWAEHRAHVLGWLPYALLLLCPLMHVFMHRGHGGHGVHGSDGGHAGHDARSDDVRRPAGDRREP